MLKKLIGAAMLLGLSTGAASAAPLDVVAFYDFQGADAADSSGNNNHGVILPGVSFVNDGRGTGNTVAAFNPVAGLSGIDTGIDINQAVIPEMTMGGWFNVDASSSPMGKFMSHDNGGFDRTLGLDTRDGGDVAAFTSNGVLSGIPAIPGEWTHVAVAYSKIDSSTSLFINGILAETRTSFFADVDSHLSLFLGTNPGFNEDFTGLMDDVFVIGEALNGTQITSLMNTGLGVSAVPVPAALPLLATALAGIGLLGRRRKSSI